MQAAAKLDSATALPKGAAMTAILAVDFGTSNSAAAMMQDGVVRRLPIETAADTLPTAVFFPADRGAMRIGAAATIRRKSAFRRAASWAAAPP